MTDSKQALKLTRVTERADSPSTAANYRGIAHKTFFFMLWAVMDVVLFFILRPILTAGEVIELDNGLAVHPLEALVFFIVLVLSVIAPLRGQAGGAHF